MDTMKMSKILLIENQHRQFQTITDLLRKFLPSPVIFPSDGEYVGFIDRIRVYLNLNYHESIRTRVLEDIKTNVKDFNPDIFIIDHILVGCHKSQTGLDLAIKLGTLGFDQPIIFLSRTLDSEESVMTKLPYVKSQCEWVHKGYAGKGVLVEEYFEGEVAKRIRKYLVLDDVNDLDEIMQFYYKLLKDLNGSYPQGLPGIVELIPLFDHSKEPMKNKLRSKLEGLQRIKKKYTDAIESRTIQREQLLAKQFLRELKEELKIV